MEQLVLPFDVQRDFKYFMIGRKIHLMVVFSKNINIYTFRNKYMLGFCRNVNKCFTLEILFLCVQDGNVLVMFKYKHKTRIEGMCTKQSNAYFFNKGIFFLQICMCFICCSLLNNSCVLYIQFQARSLRVDEKNFVPSSRGSGYGPREIQPI